MLKIEGIIIFQFSHQLIY